MLRIFKSQDEIFFVIFFFYVLGFDFCDELLILRSLVGAMVLIEDKKIEAKKHC